MDKLNQFNSNSLFVIPEKKGINFLLEKFYNSFFPLQCVFCKTKIKNNFDICPDCLKDLPYIRQACGKCGMPLPDGTSEIFSCGNCIDKKLFYDRLISLFHYQNPIDHLLISLKFSQNLTYAKILGSMLAEKMSRYYKDKHKPDFLIPMPLYRGRLCERGFNQAVEISLPIAKKLKVPLDLNSCRRVKDTLAQSSLSFLERKRNVKKSFKVFGNMAGKSVVIIDDVVTSGSTVHELSKVLHYAETKSIDVWSVARVGWND